MRKYLLVLLCFLSVSGYAATLEPYRIIPSFTGPSYEGKEVTHQTQFKIQIVNAIEFVSYTTNMSGVMLRNWSFVSFINRKRLIFISLQCFLMVFVGFGMV